MKKTSSKGNWHKPLLHVKSVKELTLNVNGSGTDGAVAPGCLAGIEC